jgi:myosin heavy subunit
LELRGRRKCVGVNMSSSLSVAPGWRKPSAEEASILEPKVLPQEVYDALPKEGVEDMTSLEQLSEDILLANLRLRFEHKLIYVRSY